MNNEIGFRYRSLNGKIYECPPGRGRLPLTISQTRLRLNELHDLLGKLAGAADALCTACEADCTSKETEMGEARCDDGEAVAMGRYGPLAMTFGDIRSTRDAIRAAHALLARGNANDGD